MCNIDTLLQQLMRPIAMWQLPVKKLMLNFMLKKMKQLTFN